jgi:hypothetical protein
MMLSAATMTVMKPVKEKKPLAVRSFHHGRRDFLVGAFVLSCSAVIVPSLADGQSRLTATLTLPMREGGGIRFWKLPGTSGLSQTRVSNIIQDDQGFIWCGTQNGLNRFKRIIHKKSLDVLPAKRLSAEKSSLFLALNIVAKARNKKDYLCFGTRYRAPTCSRLWLVPCPEDSCPRTRAPRRRAPPSPARPLD